MKILWIAKSILLAGLLFVAQKAFAAEGAPELSHQVFGVGVWSVVRSWGILTLFISGVVSPIIGYRWYARHGGTKKWLKWLAYLPFVLFILMIIAPLLRILLNQPVV